MPPPFSAPVGARPGGRDKGHRGSVQQRDEPTRHRGRARHLRVREHRRAAFQVGRFLNGGATDIGFARSLDGGATWMQGFLPGLTFNAGAFADPDSPFERVSDPSVAFDAKHGKWLISSIEAVRSD